MKDYYKKIDLSFFRYGITIPKDFIPSFEYGVPLPCGEKRDIALHWGKEVYDIEMRHSYSKKRKGFFYHLRWDKNKPLLNALKKEFIQTYIAIESQSYAAKANDKYYVTKLLGGSQEVAVFKPQSTSVIELEVFIKITTPYDNLFKRLVDENVFGWLSNTKSKERLFITKSTNWIPQKHLKKHEAAVFVIYYLLDECNKEIYIGSAERLGSRVKLNREEIPNWNKFRYEIVHPMYHQYLRQIEYHSIHNFARFFSNNGTVSSLGLTDYVLVNKKYNL